MVRTFLTFGSYRTVLDKIADEVAKNTLQSGRDGLLAVWAVRQAAKFVPAATCLTKALSVRWYLAKSGKACTIRVGVLKTDASVIKAHAWIILDGKVVIGGENREHELYKPIIDL